MDLLSTHLPNKHTYHAETITTTAKSTFAREIVYLHATHELILHLHNSSTYIYRDIDPEMWYEMKMALSLGKFYNARIRGKFPSTVCVFTVNESLALCTCGFKFYLQPSCQGCNEIRALDKCPYCSVLRSQWPQSPKQET